MDNGGNGAAQPTPPAAIPVTPVPAGHSTFSEIQDPVARAKLNGIQESVYSIDEEIRDANAAIEQRKGMRYAYELAATQVFGLCQPMAATLKDDPENADHAEVKLRVDQTKLITAMLQEMEAEQKRDLADLRGQINGMERAVTSLNTRFAAEVAKYERHERMQQEDADDDLRPADGAQASPGSPESVKPKPKPKGKAKGKTKGKAKPKGK